jgi:hypothetical protein
METPGRGPVNVKRGAERSEEFTSTPGRDRSSVVKVPDPGARSTLTPCPKCAWYTAFTWGASQPTSGAGESPWTMDRRRACSSSRARPAQGVGLPVAPEKRLASDAMAGPHP